MNTFLEAYKAAAKVRPAIANNLHLTEYKGWIAWSDNHQTWRDIYDAMVERLIEAACWRELPGYAWARDIDGTHHVLEMRSDSAREYKGPTLTLALLSAVAGLVGEGQVTQ